MAKRLIIAVVGALAITIGLFFFMDEVANRFVLRDPTQYFAITDYIRAPDRGRQLPDVPVVPEAAPERPEFELEEEGVVTEEIEVVAPPLEQQAVPSLDDSELILE